jgi:hypothetical protein
VTVDISKIKPGDEVTVRAVVHSTDGMSWGLCFKHHNGAWDGSVRHFVHPGCVVSHTPKALAVGDRVELLTGGRGFIRAIIGERAWVDLVDDPAEMMNGCAYGLAFLERDQ